MASISREGGRSIVQFGLNDKRHSYRLGKVTKRQAAQVQGFIEDLLCCKRIGKVAEAATQGWLSGLPDNEWRKLETLGLVLSRRRVLPTKFDEFVQQYIAGRQDAKPNTIMNYWQAHRLAFPMLGAKFLHEITQADGETLRISLRQAGLSEGYIGRRLKIVRQFLAAAVASGLLVTNPWAGLKFGDWSDRTRMVYVSAQDVQAVIKECRDAEWRVIVALCRFAGLRCPSEILALKWEDVDWNAGRFTVRSSKTERHQDGGQRSVPIFPELWPYLLEAYEAATEGSVYVVERYRGGDCNLRTQFERIIKRAGIEPWGKLFQNLRSSCETDLAAHHPVHVVTAWLGNSPRVALKHYLQVTEADFAKARGVVQNPVQQVSATVGKAEQGESVPVLELPKSGHFQELCCSVPSCADGNSSEAYARQDSNL
jgi:integrase